MKRVYSDWFVELGFLGRLDPDEQAEFDRCCREDAELQKRLSALQQSNREILARHPWPLERHQKATILPHPTKSRFRFRPQWALSGLAALCIFGIALSTLLILSHRDDHSLPATVREKGEVTTSPAYGLRIYRQGSEGVRQLQDGETVENGDWLQIAYHLPEAQYVYILSLDGAGRVTCHWPAASTAAEKSPGGSWFNLPDGLILDNTPGYERFFLLTADRPVETNCIIRAIEDWARNRVQAGGEIPVFSGLVFRAAVNLRKAK